MDIDGVPSKTVPPPPEAGDIGAVEKAVAELVGNVPSSHPPTLPRRTHAVNAPSSAGNDDDKPLVVEQAPANLGVLACYRCYRNAVSFRRGASRCEVCQRYELYAVGEPTGRCGYVKLYWKVHLSNPECFQ